MHTCDFLTSGIHREVFGGKQTDANEHNYVNPMVACRGLGDTEGQSSHLHWKHGVCTPVCLAGLRRSERQGVQMPPGQPVGMCDPSSGLEC